MNLMSLSVKIAHNVNNTANIIRTLLLLNKLISPPSSATISLKRSFKVNFFSAPRFCVTAISKGSDTNPKMIPRALPFSFFV